MKKAFTLIELVVAVALLAMVLSFASVVFKVSIEAYRMAGANTEIMQKLRAITDQLNADFKGQIWNPGGKVNFNFSEVTIDGKSVDVRSDSIVFFANGDFQSTGQYDYGGTDKTVVGNVACIFYGQAASPNPSTGKPEEKILVRRQTIITDDSDLDDLDLSSPAPGEYYTEKPLAELSADYAASGDGNTPEMRELVKRPVLDPNDPDDLVMYMAEGVDDFTIQYVGRDYDDPYEFEFNQWRPENKDIRDAPVEWKGKYFAPLAFKFTFTLYDSKGILENGRRFTHIGPLF
jgi:prepilin-type N-terminal cleavage/methylation domain-containing protein